MGHTPYGYKIVKGKAVIDKVQAERVIRLFESYLCGLSLRAAADSAGLSVTHCQAKNMLLNEKYLGTEYYPKIISKEIMDKAKAELRKRAERLGRVYEPKEKKEKRAVTSFIFEKEEEKFDNPYKQAEYAYSLIREVQSDG